MWCFGFGRSVGWQLMVWSCTAFNVLYVLKPPLFCLSTFSKDEMLYVIILWCLGTESNVKKLTSHLFTQHRKSPAFNKITVCSRPQNGEQYDLLFLVRRVKNRRHSRRTPTSIPPEGRACTDCPSSPTRSPSSARALPPPRRPRRPLPPASEAIPSAAPPTSFRARPPSPTRPCSSPSCTALPAAGSPLGNTPLPRRSPSDLAPEAEQRPRRRFRSRNPPSEAPSPARLGKPSSPCSFSFPPSSRSAPAAPRTP
mmetsp:Transcript_26380/g.56086  ORF Transcript_26380/g.56086 Transcript_26380/m.56086 type:complete len:254 (-) Transcript_26380:1124-1885(-)